MPRPIPAVRDRPVFIVGTACLALALLGCEALPLPPDPAGVPASVSGIAAGRTSSVTADQLAGTWLAREFSSSDTPGGLVIPRIRFDATGTANGSGGCNGFGGSFALKDGVLRIGPLAATRKACLGAAMEQEVRFLAALERTRGARVAADGVELLDAEGRITVRLSRQP